MAWYRTGTITVTNGSTTVTGSGTAWIANAGVGEALYAPDGRLYEIASISSDTTMTLASAYLGSNQSGQAYVIVPSQSYIRDLAAQAADLVNNYSTIYNTVGQGKFPDGTLAAPSIRFSDDLDTGFYRSASNEVTFVAGGVAQFKYNSSGLTLLNGSQSFTTIDATTLEVTNIKAKDGTTAIAIADSTGVATISANPVFSGGTANGVAYLDGSKVLTTGSALTFDGTNLGVGTASPASLTGGASTGVAFNGSSSVELDLATAGVRRGYFYADSNAAEIGTVTGSIPIKFGIGLSEQMRLTSTGLGIGTSSPSAKLTVSGTTAAIDSAGQILATVTDAVAADKGGQVMMGGYYTGTTSTSFGGIAAKKENATDGNYAGYLQFITSTNGSGNSEKMRIDSSGNVGIGTTTAPGSNGKGVAIYASDFPRLSFRNSTTGNANSDGTQLLMNGANFIIANTENGYTAFENNGSERMRIDSSGNVGIGTSSVDSKLHIYYTSNETNPLSEAYAGLNLEGSSSVRLLFGTYVNSPYGAYIQASNTGTAFPIILNPSGGYVGIGTSSPGATLDVVGQVVSQGSAGAFTVRPRDGSGVDWSIYNPTGDDIRLFGNSADRLILDNSGNLGLGVTPSAWWTSGNTKAFQLSTRTALYEAFAGSAVSNNTFFDGTNDKYIQTAGAAKYSFGAGGHAWSIAPSGTAGNAITFTQAMTLDASGNLGVGTTSPGSLKLKVVGAGGNLAGNAYYVGLIGDGSASNKGVGVGYDTSGQVGIIYSETSSTPSNLAFWTYSGSGWGERMRLDSSGNLLVGTTDVDAGIGGNVSTTQFSFRASSEGFRISSIGSAYYNVSDSVSTQYIIWRYTGNQVGNIAISSTGTAYNTISDYRLKENVQPMQNALAKVAQLNPVTYNWKADGSDGQGFIAHELQAVVPDAVSGEKDAVDKDGKPIYQGVDTSFIVATLTKAIQEQQDIINSLKARLDAAGL